VKSGPRPGAQPSPPKSRAGKAALLAATGRFLKSKRQGARRLPAGRQVKRGGVHVPPRRQNAVLAHSHANFPPEADPRQYNSAGAAPGCLAGKGYFFKNGGKHVLSSSLL